jgi:hypothetical protein
VFLGTTLTTEQIHGSTVEQQLGRERIAHAERHPAWSRQSGSTITGTGRLEDDITILERPFHRIRQPCRQTGSTITGTAGWKRHHHP